jgi:hypothetical protein
MVDRMQGGEKTEHAPRNRETGREQTGIKANMCARTVETKEKT